MGTGGSTGTSDSPDATLTQTVNSAGPTKLTFTSGTLTGTVGQCLGPITVQTQDSGTTFIISLPL